MKKEYKIIIRFINSFLSLLSASDRMDIIREIKYCSKCGDKTPCYCDQSYDE